MATNNADQRRDERVRGRCASLDVLLRLLAGLVAAAAGVAAVVVAILLVQGVLG